MRLSKICLGLMAAACSWNATAVQAELPNLDGLEVRTGAMFLHRSDNNDDTIMIGGPFPAGPVLDARDASPGSDTGWELAITGHLDEDRSIEFRYFHLDGFNFSTQLTDPSGIGFDVDPNGVGLFNATINGDINYTSELSNFELNLRNRVNNDVEFLYGVRHMRQEEELGGFFTAPGFPGTTNTVGFDTQNYLTGFQVGVDAVLFEHNRFRIEGVAKAGIYHNQINSTYSAVGTGDIASIDERAGNRKDVVSFVGEAELAAVYQATDQVSFRAAYQFLAMTNIATAPNQVQETDRTAPATTSVANSDCPIYNGLALQMEVWLYK
ncbi:hypothetical protein [Rubinisphaera brasiliensis]|uniref:Signal peptide-domain containing protein n=1 Tax=Rubinisphaera brasiliensis (strain ATCC 49424 / DSM 5305 / JCM 21570 / IAM 15109 / NBRC 103401 / IFAM 1448) TaxID=756272 RepID=F0SJU9_RUBBR|nr:hypothetical protein [Rubinisphaera brasiliensis]ADY58638.1 protein of unknown function DUF1551 [Rubinisphaera brasiliensis DSM 5305]